MNIGGLQFATEFARLAAANERESTTILGGVGVRLVRVAGGGEGRWDSHSETAETAICWSGDFTVTFRDGAVDLGPGGCCVVPVGVEHRGTSKNGAEVVLFTSAAP